MNIRKATKHDIPKIMKEVDKIIKQMKAEGNPQWDTSYPTDDIFYNDVEKGQLYICFDTHRILGCAVLSTIYEPFYYTCESSFSYTSHENDTTIAYFHRFLLFSNSVGQGHAAECMHTLCDYAQRELHVKAIYGDTADTNIRMSYLYEKVGFRETGRRSREGKTYQYILYEYLL